MTESLRDAVVLRALALTLAVVLDFALGDPPTRVHPVAWLGSAVARLERTLRRTPTLDGLLGGAVLAAVTVALATGAAFAVSSAAHSAGPVAGVAVDAALVWLALAARSLAAEGRAVARMLESGDLQAARQRVGRLVARRTGNLSESDVARAAVESMGENVVDAVIAPLLWAAVLGPAGAWLHKSASTLDSMVGYRTPRHERFGTASARLDDLLAWVPARAALAVVPVAAAAAGFDARGALRVARRDRLKHASPNSAHGEALFAGALGVELGGPTEYAGGIRDNPVIGAGGKKTAAVHAHSAAALVIACGLVLLVAFALPALALR